MSEEKLKIKNLCRDYESNFKNRAGITWRPWVGIDYPAMEASRILIVGESHYVWGDSTETAEQAKNSLGDFSFTRNLINHDGLFGKDPGKPVFLRNIERVLFNAKAIAKNQQQMLWKSVSFYNFLQRPLKSRQGKDRPNDNDWSAGWETLFQVIEILQPEYILFCGVGASNAWSRLEKNIDKGEFKLNIKKVDKVGNTILRTGIISKKGSEWSAKMVFIKHPSSYFSWDKWAKCISGKLPDFRELMKGAETRELTIT